MIRPRTTVGSVRTWRDPPLRPTRRAGFALTSARRGARGRSPYDAGRAAGSRRRWSNLWKRCQRPSPWQEARSRPEPAGGFPLIAASRSAPPWSAPGPPAAGWSGRTAYRSWRGSRAGPRRSAAAGAAGRSSLRDGRSTVIGPGAQGVSLAERARGFRMRSCRAYIPTRTRLRSTRIRTSSAERLRAGASGRTVGAARPSTVEAAAGMGQNSEA